MPGTRPEPAIASYEVDPPSHPADAVLIGGGGKGLLTIARYEEAMCDRGNPGARRKERAPAGRAGGGWGILAIGTPGPRGDEPVGEVALRSTGQSARGKGSLTTHAA